MEKQGLSMRLNNDISPEVYKCASVTKGEMEQLRTVEGVVRLGRVLEITSTEIVLERGSISTDSSIVHVDCTANGVVARPRVPVFQGNKITLQSLWLCQQVMSSSLIARLECQYADDAAKNNLAIPCPHPNNTTDVFDVFDVTLKNTLAWIGDLRMALFLRTNRLSLIHYVGWPHGPMSDALSFAYALWGSSITTRAHQRVAVLGEGTAHSQL
jgi:hypothetical protein